MFSLVHYYRRNSGDAQDTTQHKNTHSIDIQPNTSGTKNTLLIIQHKGGAAAIHLKIVLREARIDWKTRL